MRIFSLDPGITELIYSLKLENSLCGVSHLCDYPEGVSDVPQVTQPERAGEPCHRLGYFLKPELLQRESPDLILTSFDQDSKIELFSNWVHSSASEDIKIHSWAPTRLEQVYSMIEGVGAACSAREQGFLLSQKLKAQFSSWVDNFYDRIKHKRVLLLNDIEPLTMPGRWVADMVRLNSSELVGLGFGEQGREISWKEIQELNPDVFLFAPEGEPEDDNLGYFKYFEKQDGWEDLLAVKRGQVYFSRGGLVFSRPTMRLMSAMAFLVSTLAGFDSGYITERDSFQRLRWLEVQRHRFTS